jgi:hypothetical protein
MFCVIVLCSYFCEGYMKATSLSFNRNMLVYTLVNSCNQTNEMGALYLSPLDSLRRISVT